MSLPCTAGPYPYSPLSLEHLVAEHAHKKDGSHKLCLLGSLNQPLSVLPSADASSAVGCSSPASRGTYHQGNMAHQGPQHFCELTGRKLVAKLPGFQVAAMDALLEKAIQRSFELVVQKSTSVVTAKYVSIIIHYFSTLFFLEYFPFKYFFS
jgi:hypothetical protein